MRKIGDYVHLHYNNYRNLGINQEDTEGSSGFPDYGAQREEFLETVPQIKIDTAIPPEVFNIIKKTRGNSGNNNVIKKMNDKIFNTMFDNYKIDNDKLNEYFTQILNNSFNPETYNIILEKKYNKVLRIQKKANSDFINGSILIDTIEKLNNNFLGIVNDLNNTNQIKAAYQGVYTEFKKFCKKLGLTDKNGEIDLDNVAVKKDYSKLFNYNKDKINEYSLENIIKTINSYTLFNNFNENVLKGGIFETYLAIVFHSYIDIQTDKLTDEALEKTIESFNNQEGSKVVGDQGSKNEIVISNFNFSQDVTDKNDRIFFKKNFPGMNLSLDDNDGLKMETSLVVQDKIDVQVEWTIKMENNTNEKVKTNISAKNVTMKNYIDIVSNTSLLTFFNYSLNYSEYFTHVMNIFAYQKNKIGARINPANKTSFQDCLNSLRSFILVQALTGMKNNKANIFAVNNNQTGAITFVSTYGLLKSLDKINYNYTSIKMGNASIKNYILMNDEVKGDENSKAFRTRIDNILSQLHNDKLTASINPVILDQISGDETIAKKFSF